MQIEAIVLCVDLPRNLLILSFEGIQFTSISEYAPTLDYF